MQITKTHKIIISALVVIILLGIYVLFDRESKKENETNITDTNQTATTTDSSDESDTQGVTYKIEPMPTNTGKVIPKPIPDLNRPVTKSPMANVSESDVLRATAKIKEFQTALKSDPSVFVNWLDLASYQKMAGDYDGAIISWTYASKVIPTDYISLANIGNLYAYYLKDNAQAEVYYKMAISRGPTQPYLYSQLAQVYIDFFKDTTKAKAIIAEGLSKNPNEPVLLEFQESLK